MRRSVFAVCDLEASYAYNLMTYLNGRKATPFEVQAFTNSDSLIQFSRDHEVEILLISTRAMSDEIRELPINRIIILSEGERLQNLEEYPFVYKYQSSDSLLAEVMGYYAESNPHSKYISLGTKKAKIYGVYSPVSRTGKTRFALTLGEVLAKQKSALYLNFEEFSGFEELFGVKYRADLSDLIYFARQKEGSLIYKLNSVIQTFHDLQYIPPALSPADLRDVTSDEWVEFIREISECCDYEYIVLDLSEQVDDLYRIMRMCDRIFMPLQDDPIALAKHAQYEKLAVMLDYQDVLEKTTQVYPPLQMLPRDCSDLPRLLEEGEMGHFVRMLLSGEENDG